MGGVDDSGAQPKDPPEPAPGESSDPNPVPCATRDPAPGLPTASAARPGI
jgi:hypothetical protein